MRFVSPNTLSVSPSRRAMANQLHFGSPDLAHLIFTRESSPVRNLQPFVYLELYILVVRNMERVVMVNEKKDSVFSE